MSFGIDGGGRERRFSRPPDEYLVRPRVTDWRIKAKRKGWSSEFGAFIFIARLPCLRVTPGENLAAPLAFHNEVARFKLVGATFGRRNAMACI